jgi:hypothetical protein
MGFRFLTRQLARASREQGEYKDVKAISEEDKHLRYSLRGEFTGLL